MEKTGKEGLYKNVWKLGRNGLVEPASIVFNTSFKYTSSKPYDWSVVTKVLARRPSSRPMDAHFWKKHKENSPNLSYVYGKT